MYRSLFQSVSAAARRTGISGAARAYHSASTATWRDLYAEQGPDDASLVEARTLWAKRRLNPAGSDYYHPIYDDSGKVTAYAWVGAAQWPEGFSHFLESGWMDWNVFLDGTGDTGPTAWVEGEVAIEQTAIAAALVTTGAVAADVPAAREMALQYLKHCPGLEPEEMQVLHRDYRLAVAALLRQQVFAGSGIQELSFGHCSALEERYQQQSLALDTPAESWETLLTAMLRQHVPDAKKFIEYLLSGQARGLPETHSSIRLGSDMVIAILAGVRDMHASHFAAKTLNLLLAHVLENDPDTIHERYGMSLLELVQAFLQHMPTSVRESLFRTFWLLGASQCSGLASGWRLSVPEEHQTIPTGDAVDAELVLRTVHGLATQKPNPLIALWASSQLIGADLQPSAEGVTGCTYPWLASAEQASVLAQQYGPPMASTNGSQHPTACTNVTNQQLLCQAAYRQDTHSIGWLVTKRDVNLLAPDMHGASPFALIFHGIGEDNLSQVMQALITVWPYVDEEQCVRCLGMTKEHFVLTAFDMHVGQQGALKLLLEVQEVDGLFSDFSPRGLGGSKP